MNKNSDISNCNLQTGFDDLDWMLTGMHGGDLIAVGGRPGMGKTAFALNIVLYAALKCQKSVAVFSLDMSKEQLVNRMFTANSHNLRTVKMFDKEWTQPVEGTLEAADARLFIDDTVSISISELHSKCRKFKLEHGLDMIMIDYLQLMTGSGKSDTRQQEISDISRSLKTLAKELNVPVIALSQMSRQVEERPDHRPMLSDLRECRAIEQDADVIMFIYRDDYYNSDTTTCSNTAEIIVAKNNNGDIGTVKLDFAKGRFFDKVK